MNTLTRYAPVALAVLRIVAALLFIEHGTQKLFGFPAMQSFGPPPDAGDGGADDGGAGDAGAPALATFSFPSTAVLGQAVSDDPASSGGAAAVLLEPNGANFVYVSADGSKRSVTGTVLTAPNSAQVAISNYRGSFTVSLYDSVKHSTQVVASGCQ